MKQQTYRQTWEDKGRKDADKGIFCLPHPVEDDIDDKKDNQAYVEGFARRKLELGDKFEWRC